MNTPHGVRPSTKQRRGGLLSLILSVAVIAVLAVALEAPAPRAELKHTALSDANQFPGSFTKYAPPELYGGGAPAETCFVCNSVNSDNVGTSASSVDPNNDVNPATGDFSTTDTLFSAPDVGPSLKLDLSYDAQWAQSEEKAAQNNQNFYPGAYGWGWGSNFNISTYNSGGNVTVTDVNDAQMTFNLPGYQDSCPVGDYEDFQKYTYPFSAEPYCAPQRVNSQLGYLPAYNAYQLSENGGKDVYVFEATTGQLIDEGNANSNALMAMTYSVSPGTGQCPTGVSSCTVASDSGGRSITQAVSSGLVTQVIDPAGNHYNLGFNGDYLTTVTNVAHNNATSYFSYYNGNPSPYNAQIHSIEDPDTNITTIGYNAQGMASDESDALNHDIHYAYGNTACTNSCLDPGESQMTTVTYADGETDVDHYFEGILTASSFGDASSSNANFETWTYNYNFPSASNQNGDTYERIVQPGAAQSTSTTVVVMDPAGNVYESNDVNGNVTSNMYNDTGGNNLDELCWTARPGVSVPANATCSTPPAGSTSYTYDQYGNRTSQTDPLGNTTRYGYYETSPGSATNLDGLLCWEAQASVTGAGSTCTSASGPSGAPTGATAYTYDSYGDQTAKTVDYGASPSLTSYSGNYNAYGEAGYTIPAQGQGSGNSPSNPYATTDTYWPWGALETKTAPDSGAVTDTYDAANNLIGVQAPLNEAASYGYNADEQQCWSVKGTSSASGTCASPPANATVTTYQANTSAPATVTDPLGHETQYFYNDHAYQTKPTEIEDPAQSEITYNAYDAYGNVCASGPVQPPNDSPSQCNRISGDTAAQYNSAGSELASWDAMGNETTYAYANTGYDTLVTSSTTAMNQTTSYTYDNDGRLVTTNEPNGNAVSVGYNNDGLKCAQAPVANASLGCSPSGAVGDTTYGYDGANELTSMQDNNGVSGAPPLNTNTYTNGTLTGASDDNGKTVSYLYGYSGELLCIAYPVGTPSCGSIGSRATPSVSNAIVNYGYDADLRTTSVAAWTGLSSNPITYGYSDSLNPTSVTQISYPTTSSDTLSYQYDAAGNLKNATYGGQTLGGQSDSYNYNNDEQLSNYSLLNGPTSPTVTYSSYKQVTSALDPGQSTPNSYNVTPNGEITQVSQGSVIKSAAYNTDGGVCWSLNGNSSNGCGNAPTGATTYSYDANGQRTAATTGSNTRSNGWNAFGQMCWTAPTSSSAGCGSAPSGATSYSYAGNGLRVSATTGATTTPFTWDLVSGGSTPLDLSDGTNAYIYGPLLFGGTAPIEQISTGGVNPTTSSFLASTPSGVQAVIGEGSQISATSPADKFTFDSISPVGRLASQNGKGQSQLNVSPQTVGDAIVLSVGVFSTSAPTVTSVSGGDSTWQKLTNTTDSTAGSDTELWLGTVTTTGGPGSPIRVSYSGSVTNITTELNAQEYTNGTGSSTSWSADVVGNSHNDTPSTTVTFPSLTPSANGDAYVGYAYVPNRSGAGTTSGFTYDSTQGGNSFIYDTNVSMAVSPAATQATAGDSDAVGALLKASLPASSSGISAVGSLVSRDGPGTTSTLAVSPQNVGDAIVLSVGVFSTSAPTVTSVSGGGCTWQKLTNTTDSTAGSDTELWLGTVTTTGNSTITVTYSSNPMGLQTELNAQEYTNGAGTSTTWSADVVGNSHNDTASTTVTFPSLTPSTTGEAYVGYAYVQQGQSTVTGTSGFTFDVTQHQDLFMYNTAVSSTVSPTAIISNKVTKSDAVGALLKATAPVSSGLAVTSISPSSGSISGGTSVSITGSNFTGATAVNFGGIAATSFTVNSSTSITAVAPAGTAGSVDVTVTVPSSGSNLLEVASYSLYGVQTIQTGSDVTPFGFQGSYTDPSGFIYLVNRYYDPTSDQFLRIDPAVGLTGQAYEAFGDNPMNAQDPLGLCNGPDGICINQNTGVMNVNSSLDAGDHANPGVSPLVSVQNFIPPGSPEGQLITAVNQAAADFHAAEVEQQRVLRAKKWLAAELNAGANCDGTDWGNLEDDPGFVGSDPCTPADIAHAGGFIGCPPNSQPCGDEWIPVGSHSAGFNAMNGTGAGPWAEGFFEFLDGCWEGGGLGAVAGAPADIVGSVPGAIFGCVVTGAGAVGAEQGAKAVAGGG